MTDLSENNQNNLSPVDKLKLARQEYQYNYSHIPPIAMVDQLPSNENFSTGWLRLLAKELKVVFINTLIANRGNRGSESVRDDVRLFLIEVLAKGALPFNLTVSARILQIIPNLLLTGISKDYSEIDELFFSILRESGLSIFQDSLSRVKSLLYEKRPRGHAKSLNDYHKLFPEMGIPKIAENFSTDEQFAYMRVAGYNPVMIEQVNKLGDRFPVTEAQYREVMGDDSLAAAGEEGRLYLADYGILKGAVNGTFPSQQKYIYAPLALFAIPKNSNSNKPTLMRPVAIQCGQNPQDNPIITPKSDKYAWLFAKTIVQIADANYHEAVTHLGRTHLLVGPFVVATHRQLPDSHPLNILLSPHFEGTLAINDAAQRRLIAAGGGVDKLLASTIDNSRVLAAVGLQSYGFNEAMLPKQLEKRGVNDTQKLPVYPYRDDALLVWNTIHQWVGDYLNIYYKSDADVKNDTKLQNWAIEAGAFDGGRVPDFGQQHGLIQTLDYLIDAITLIIFTASAQHAAVNFPQGDMMNYAPAVPLAGYQPASILEGKVTEENYLNLLPPLEQAQEQLNLVHLLGSIYYQTLGDYPENYFKDTLVKPALQQFRNNLIEVEATIHQRNQNRPTYEYLLPSKIPQSINI
ncbi:lipoxygenase [Rivularia sp. PCC 7116]|uniref:lipoxygenase family protein n=1 Tax=Rivularia sp. PCC 7116 TaxID=373994 RepID=UPI00029F3C24|nr:lipoxygenase family protein [Rivularia sp. PCC 7116]AFY58433.1 lipoxygenase [Rivularia sp. PCC 7116]